MSENDFIREVDEELKQDRLRQMWDRYGLLLILLCLAAVIGTGGWQGYRYHQANQAAQAGKKFVEALRLHQQNLGSAGAGEFTNLGESLPSGYALLAKLNAAVSFERNSKKDEALRTYQHIIDTVSADDELAQIAQIRSVYLGLQDLDFEEVEKKLADFVAPRHAFRFSAGELLGVSAVKANKLTEAERYFAAILAEQDQAPATLLKRVEQMHAIVSANLDSQGS